MVQSVSAPVGETPTVRFYSCVIPDFATLLLFSAQCLRGDVGCGNEVVIRCCEDNFTHYLFKAKRTKNICEIFRLHLANGGRF